MGSMKSLLDLEEAMGGGGICTPSKNKFYPFLRICVTTSERGEEGNGQTVNGGI